MPKHHGVCGDKEEGIKQPCNYSGREMVGGQVPRVRL